MLKTQTCLGSKLHRITKSIHIARLFYAFVRYRQPLLIQRNPTIDEVLYSQIEAICGEEKRLGGRIESKLVRRYEHGTWCILRSLFMSAVGYFITPLFSFSPPLRYSTLILFLSFLLVRCLSFPLFDLLQLLIVCTFARLRLIALW